MDSFIGVFQFEIRYNHILNFSEFSRKIVAPFVRLSQGINIEKQGNIEERIILNFDDEDYLIAVSWDRIYIKGQNSFDKFTSKNSPLELPFFALLDKLKELTEFGSVINTLFIANFVKKLDITKEEATERFIGKTIQKEFSSSFDDITDIGIELVSRSPNEDTTLIFGPYLGAEEFDKRNIKPINIAKLGDLAFIGVMTEYKTVRITKD